MENKLKSLSLQTIKGESIIQIYLDLLAGKIKAFPSGTWQDDRNVVILIRYVLEIRMGLSKEEIPKITKKDIQAHKLWGALNRFKSIRRLIYFVYPGEYHECDFPRVTVGYWEDPKKIKDQLERVLHQQGLGVKDIPEFINYDLLVSWGFSNPLKRYGHSPYRLLNALYPNQFRVSDFKKIPHNIHHDLSIVKKQFIHMLQIEQISLNEVPRKVNKEMLMRHRFSSILKLHSNSVSKLVLSLFPNTFAIEEFPMVPNGYWADLENVKKAIHQLLKNEKIAIDDIPRFLTKKKLKESKLGGLLAYYNGSPIEIVEAIYPQRFMVFEFQRVPNKYWYKRENRIKALRDYCKKHNITREGLPLLNSSYFRKHFPRFISIVDRHYDSKFYQWIIESYPEYQFAPHEFNLLLGKDGQLCDSKEELVIHNFLIQILPNAQIMREANRFHNKIHHEEYIPDWIIEQNGRKYIVEYFGLYHSSLYKDYREKTERKIRYYNTLAGYELISIFPEDFKVEGFENLRRLLNNKGLCTNN